MIVIAGVNFFRESLRQFVEYAIRTEATVGVHEFEDAEEEISKSHCLLREERDRIVA